MTIMKLNGPWYNDPIPGDIFLETHIKGWNMTRTGCAK